MAKVPRPVGASHSSQAKPRAIKDRTANRATVRVQRTLSLGRLGGRPASAETSMEEDSDNIFGMIAAMSTTRDWRGDGRQRWAEALETLRNWPWFDTVKTLRLRFREDRLGLTAGSLTFTTLIALVPLLTVMLAVFTAFPMFANFQDSLQKYFLQSLVPDGIAKPVLGALTQFSSKAHRLGTAGLVFLVVSALALMLTIDRTLNGIWRVRKSRPLAQRVLVYWAAATLGPLVLGVSLSLTSYAVSASKGFVGDIAGGTRLLFDVVEFVLLAVTMSGLFHYVPNTHVRWRHAIAGGIFVSVGFELAKRALSWYVSSVGSFSTIYGAFAIVPIFLLWLYLSWVIVLLGAVVAAYAPSLQMRVVRLGDTPGLRFALALKVLAALQQARTAATRGLDMAHLATQLRIEPIQLEPVVEELMALDWVARLDEEGGQRYVLLAEPEHTVAAPLINSMLLAPQDELLTFRSRAGLDRMVLADLLRR